MRKRWRLARTPDRRSRGRPAWKGWPGRRRPWDAVRPVGATVSAPIWTTVSLCDHPTWHDCVGDPRVHPDGQRIAFHVSTPDLHVTYNNVIHLWEPHRGARQLTHGQRTARRGGRRTATTSPSCAGDDDRDQPQLANGLVRTVDKPSGLRQPTSCTVFYKDSS